MIWNNIWDMSETNSPQKRAIAYSLLAHIRTSGSFAGGPLDIFAPIVKNILQEVFADGTSSKGESLQELGDAIFERYNLVIPIPVLRNILVKIKDEVNAASGKEDIRIFNDGGFWIEKYIFEDYKDEVRKSKEEFLETTENEIVEDDVELEETTPAKKNKRGRKKKD